MAKTTAGNCRDIEYPCMSTNQKLWESMIAADNLRPTDASPEWRFDRQGMMETMEPLQQSRLAKSVSTFAIQISRLHFLTRTFAPAAVCTSRSPAALDLCTNATCLALIKLIVVWWRKIHAM